MSSNSQKNSEKILIIAKSNKFSNSILDVLNDSGYSADIENSGVKGLSKMSSTSYDLIVLDINLPDIDGYEVLSKKIVDSNAKDVPVFLISTDATPINMRNVPPGSVKEFIMSMNSEVTPVISKINAYFGKVSQPTKGNAKAYKILWVEDDKLIGTILSKKFISSGFILTQAKSGDEAANILNENQDFDAILLDLILPGMSGFDVLQKIKDNNKTKNIPVMILSNLSKPSDVERAKILGASKFVVKAAASLDKIVTETNELCAK